MSVTAFPADARYAGAQPTTSRPCDRCGATTTDRQWHAYSYGEEHEFSFRELFEPHGLPLPNVPGDPTFCDTNGIGVRALMVVCARCHADHRAHRRWHKHGKDRRNRR